MAPPRLIAPALAGLQAYRKIVDRRGDTMALDAAPQRFSDLQVLHLRYLSLVDHGSTMERQILELAE